MTSEQRFHGVAIIIAVSILFTAPASASAVILWGAPVGTNTLVTIDTATGDVIDTFASPVTNNSVTGLTLAEEGASLLYIDSSGGPLYRLDPNTAAVVSTSTLSFADTGGLSYQTNAGTDSIFVLSGSGGIVRQQGFGGPTTAPFSPISTGAPGALGGDDNGRHFAAVFNGSIQEFDPATGQFAAQAIQGPGVILAGLAYDGEFLYASASETATLYRRNPDLNTSWESLALSGVSAPLVGLAMAPDPPATTPPTITAATLNGFDGNITVPEGTASVLAKATVGDAGTEDVSVTIGSLAPITVTGGNGTTSPDATLSSPANVNLADEGVVPVTFDASDGTSSATQVTRNIVVTNVAPTMDFLTASYNPTIMLIDNDSVVASALSVPLGTEVTFAFEINDPGLADGITASFDIGGTIFNFGPTINGTLADLFVYTFSSAGDVVIDLSFSDGDGGDIEMPGAVAVSVEAAATPEPASLLLMLFGSIFSILASFRPRRVR